LDKITWRRAEKGEDSLKKRRTRKRQALWKAGCEEGQLGRRTSWGEGQLGKRAGREERRLGEGPDKEKTASRSARRGEKRHKLLKKQLNRAVESRFQILWCKQRRIKGVCKIPKLGVLVPLDAELWDPLDKLLEVYLSVPVLVEDF
jgi:hypothetical protein